MDKRGELHFNVILMAFFRFIVLFLVAITMVFFVMHFMKMSLDISEVESELFIQSVMNSPHSISSVEDGRVYPGIVDLSVWRNPSQLSAQLEATFHFDTTQPIAAKLELISTKTTFEPVYYHEDRFKTWYALAKTLFPGPGGAKALEKRYPVLVKDGTLYSPATLRITIATPNT
jgi:hypothetical protein